MLFQELDAGERREEIEGGNRVHSLCLQKNLGPFQETRTFQDHSFPRLSRSWKF